MDRITVIAEPTPEEEQLVVMRFRAWFRDPDALTLILHKPGARLATDDAGVVRLECDGRDLRPVQTC